MTTATLQADFRVPKGTVIFRQGDPGDQMFVVVEGRVRLTIGADGHEKEIAVLSPGEFFGELSLLRDMPRSATAEALDDTTLLVIGRDVFAMMVQDDLGIVFRMMNTQGQRLSQTNAPVQDLTQRLGGIRIAVHALRRLLGRPTPLPAVVDVAALASELRLSPAVVAGTIADLVQQGAGSVDAGVWHIHDAKQLDKLLEAVCRCAEGRGA